MTGRSSHGRAQACAGPAQGIPLPGYSPSMTWLAAYAAALLALLADLWLYMIVGFVVAGVVEEFVSKERLLRYFGRNDFRSLLRAAAAGFAVSTCSCGAIPLAASLRNRGASTAATLTFLLASPWLGVPMLMVHARFLGWQRTLFLVALCIAVSLFVGLILAWLERRGAIVRGEHYGEIAPEAEAAASADDGDCCEDSATTGGGTCSPTDGGSARHEKPSQRILRNVPLRAWRLGREIVPYLLIGLLLAAIPRAFLEVDTVSSYLGHEAGPAAIFAILPAAAVLECCSEGFAVIGGQLFRQGATLAVVFVMTMVGVTTDLTEMIVVWKKFGRRTALTYLGIGTTVVVAVGLLLQWLGEPPGLFL